MRRRRGKIRLRVRGLVGDFFPWEWAVATIDQQPGQTNDGTWDA